MNRVKFTTANTVIAIMLLITFIVSVLFVLSFCLRSYHSIGTSSKRAFNERTCLAYLTERLRHGDCEGAVHVGEFDGLNAIFIDSEYEGISYNSIIYCYDGWLYEIFCEKDDCFLKSDGSRIVETNSVVFSEPKSGLFQIEFTDLSGNDDIFHLYIRSGGSK